MTTHIHVSSEFTDADGRLDDQIVLHTRDGATVPYRRCEDGE